MASITRGSCALILLAGLCIAKEACDDVTTCEDISSDAVHGSAMIQVHAAPSGKKNEKMCGMPGLQEKHLTQSRDCLPDGLQEKHLHAVRSHAVLLATDGASKVESAADGATAPLTAAGFKDVSSLCCPPQMETFFTRLLTSKGLDVCSAPHVQGLMHWFSCVPDMDFAYVVDVIDNGNPCKFWAPSGTTCPALSATCQGKWCR